MRTIRIDNITLMYRTLINLIVFFVLSIHLNAQENQRSYHVFVNGKVALQNPSLQWESLKQSSNAQNGGFVYCLLQFNAIPLESEKAQMELEGIRLLHYAPNYAWIVQIDTSLSAASFENFDVRGISAIQPEWKIPTDMQNLSSTEELEVRILFLNSQEDISLDEICGELGVKVEKVGPLWVDATITGSLVSSIAAHPLVQFIEWDEGEPVNEGILEQAQRAVSTYISDNPGKGYYFDGTGVRIAVNEGGNVDTLEDPNFRSRLDRNSESGTSVSGHKTGVALRMSGAGNLDPTKQGTAYGADIYSGGIDYMNAATNLVTIVNQSYGWGCPSSSETYSSGSQNYDNFAYNYPTFTITHSAGNVGSSVCYADTIAGYGNITGMPKMAKNIFVVGATGTDGNLTGFSSRGPAKDGRILPNIVAPGEGGTSHASPNLAGVYAQLNQAYRYHNSGSIPQAGLLKAVIMNTADDMENPGPDFRTGYGSINARRAYDVVRQNQIITSSVVQGAMNTHTITVPSNAKEVRVLVYWTDYPATPGITTKALVNDLDMVLTDPNTQNFQPWVLNPAFNINTIDDPAVQGTDTLNNMEQVTIVDPVPGTYTLTVNGTMVPQGPQSYFVTYEIVNEEIVVTHPHGGEKFVPNENQRIRWDANPDAGTFDLSYSLNNGSSWTSIATGLSADARFYDWTVPTAITNEALIKVERGATVGESDTTFTIYEQIENLELVWSCADSSLFYWDDLAGADGYVVYRIVGDYMDSIAYTTSNFIVLNGLSSSEIEYVSVGAYVNGITSRRVVAIERIPSDSNCVISDVGCVAVINPGVENLPSCMLSANSQLTVAIQNWGVSAMDTIPVAYQLNGGPVVWDTIYPPLISGDVVSFAFSQNLNLQNGPNSIAVWTALSSDLDNSNDTIYYNVNLYTTSGSSSTLSEDFDGFLTCSTAWGCEGITCALQGDWYNIPNLAGDDIDWRTNSNGTGTGSTGPSGDHTSGSGNYLYLEGSGNGGSGCLNNTAKLYSPCVDLTSSPQAEISFWYHAYGSGIGELHLDVIADGQLYEDIMTPIIGNQGDQWLLAEADLSAFSGQTIVVVIRGSTGGGFASDLAIDDINISFAPVADFTATETTLCLGQSTVLNNNSIQADSYEWIITPSNVIYLNGTSNTSANPDVYFGSGSFSVQLVATNAFGTDTLTFTDYIYVWNGSPTLSPVTDYCQGDSVIIQGNNNGQPVEYYLNGSLENSGTMGDHYYSTAQDGDLIYAVYPVNGGCTLYSDTLEVNMTSIDVAVDLFELTLTNSGNSGASFQWVDCNNGYTPIFGETGNSFTASANGSYAVVITNNGCVDTSACHIIDNVGLQSFGDDRSIALFPNPTSGTFTIEFGEIQSTVTLEITNSIGQLVKVEEFENAKEIQSTISVPPGVYFVTIRNFAGETVMPLVVN